MPRGVFADLLLVHIAANDHNVAVELGGEFFNGDEQIRICGRSTVQVHRLNVGLDALLLAKLLDFASEHQLDPMPFPHTVMICMATFLSYT